MSAVVPDLLPAGAARLELPVGGGRLAAIATAPAGPGAAAGTVVLVPGYTGSKEDFQPLLEPLSAAGHRAVALDQRGQFESAGTGDRGSYTVASLAADLLAALASLDDGPVHLVGHSFGGLVCRAAVIAAPESVRSLVLMGSGPGALGGDRRTGLELFLPLLDQYDLASAIWLVEAVQAADPNRAPVDPAVAAFGRRRMLAGDPAALAGMGRALLEEPDRTDELAATGVPILVLYGEADDAWPPVVQTAMAHRLGAPVEVVGGCGHSPAADAPQPTAEALCRFFRALAR